MFKLRTTLLSPFFSGALLCAAAGYAPLALAGWSAASSLTPSLVVAGTDKSLYAASSSAVYASSDAGKTWGTTATPPISAYTALAYVNSALWVGTSGSGTAFSSNGGSSWSTANSGQKTPLIGTYNGISGIAKAGSALLAVSNTSSSYRSTDNGTTWTFLGCDASGLPHTGSGFSLACLPVNTVAGGSSGTAIAGTSTGLYRSTDSGATWTSVALSGQNVTQVISAGSAFYAIVAGSVYRSTNDGVSWAAVSISGSPTALAASADGASIYIGTSAGNVYYSTDGSTWKDISDSSTALGSITGLAVPASDATSVVAISSKGIYTYSSGAVSSSLNIPAITGAPMNTSIVSDTITISGLTAATPISITGGSYSVNGGAFTQNSGTVTNGATVQVRLTSAGTPNTTSTATLTVGKATGTFSVTTFKQTLINNVSEVLTAPANNVSVQNGALLVSGNATVQFNSTLANNLLVNLNSGSTLNYSFFNLPVGQNYTIQVVGGGNTTLTTINNNVALLSGQINLTPPVSTTPQTLPIYTPAGGGTLTIPSGFTTPPTFSIGQTGNLVVPSVSVNSQSSTPIIINGVSLGFVDLANRFAAGSNLSLYGGETLDFNNSGAVNQIRIGSLNGDKGQAGDPLSTVGNLDTSVSVPKLSGTVPRTGGTLLDIIKSGLDTQLGGSGTISYDATTGIVTYTLAGKNYRFIPIGNPTVALSSATSDQNQYAATNAGSTVSGTFSLTSKGVQVTLGSALGYFTDFDKALKGLDAKASFKLKSNGSLQVLVGGNTYYAMPSSQSSGGTLSGVGFGFDSAGFLSFQDSSGSMQTLYPVFADLNVLDSTLKSLDGGASTSYTGGGTTSAVISKTPYVFKPGYQLISVPASHSNDLWWIDGGTVYIRYPDNTAQGFNL